MGRKNKQRVKSRQRTPKDTGATTSETSTSSNPVIGSAPESGIAEARTNLEGNENLEEPLGSINITEERHAKRFKLNEPDVPGPNTDATTSGTSMSNDPETGSSAKGGNAEIAANLEGTGDFERFGLVTNLLNDDLKFLSDTYVRYPALKFNQQLNHFFKWPCRRTLSVSFGEIPPWLVKFPGEKLELEESLHGEKPQSARSSQRPRSSMHARNSTFAECMKKMIPQKIGELDLPDLEHLAEECIAIVGEHLPYVDMEEVFLIGSELTTAQTSKKIDESVYRATSEKHVRDALTVELLDPIGHIFLAFINIAKRTPQYDEHLLVYGSKDIWSKKTTRDLPLSSRLVADRLQPDGCYAVRVKGNMYEVILVEETKIPEPGVTEGARLQHHWDKLEGLGIHASKIDMARMRFADNFFVGCSQLTLDSIVSQCGVFILSDRAWTVIYEVATESEQFKRLITELEERPKRPESSPSGKLPRDLFKEMADDLLEGAPQILDKFIFTYGKARFYEIPCRAAIIKNSDPIYRKVILGLLYKSWRTFETRSSQPWHRLFKSLLRSTEEVDFEITQDFKKNVRSNLKKILELVGHERQLVEAQGLGSTDSSRNDVGSPDSGSGGSRLSELGSSGSKDLWSKGTGTKGIDASSKSNREGDGSEGQSSCRTRVSGAVLKHVETIFRVMDVFLEDSKWEIIKEDATDDAQVYRVSVEEFYSQGTKIAAETGLVIAKVYDRKQWLYEWFAESLPDFEGRSRLDSEGSTSLGTETDDTDFGPGSNNLIYGETPDEKIDVLAFIEIAAYLQMKNLQGYHIPKLLDFGFLRDISAKGTARGPFLLITDVGNRRPDRGNYRHFKLAVQGLEAIHRCRVAHGDIAGRNMRIVKVGDAEKVYFYDFTFCAEGSFKKDWRQLLRYFEREPEDIEAITGRHPYKEGRLIKEPELKVSIVGTDECNFDSIDCYN